MSRVFEPVAIVGQSYILPDALTPNALWQLVLERRCVLSESEQGVWGKNNNDFIEPFDGDERAIPYDKAWNSMGGYVKGFESVFKPESYDVDQTLIAELDPLFQWVLHTGKTALEECQHQHKKTGVILGNLSYPTRAFHQVAQRVWNRDLELDAVNPLNRFMSGYPAALLAQALKLSGPAYCIDAACASSLYAIKLACDVLQQGGADIMLAGGVNAADSLFLSVGFTSLGALSKTGQSRPFHKNADGLVPATGGCSGCSEALARC